MASFDMKAESWTAVATAIQCRYLPLLQTTVLRNLTVLYFELYISLP